MKMTKDEIRREEDYFADKNLSICDGCANKGGDTCPHCRHHYDSLFVLSEVVKAVRED